MHFYSGQPMHFYSGVDRLPVSPLAGFVRVEVLGLYPTVQGIAAQLAMAALLLIGYWNNQRRASANGRETRQ